MRKGTKHTPETIQKIRKSVEENPAVLATQFKKGQIPPNKGKILSVETKHRISEAKKGSIPWNKGKTGVFHHSEATKLKISQSTQGAGGNNWRGGITPANRLGRSSIKYKAWQSAVFHKDNYTCQVCEAYGEYLHADHIKSFSKHAKLRYDVDNGRTLCRACHFYITFKRKMPSASKWGLSNFKLK